VYLGDVARVEIGQESYGGDSRFNGMPAAGFAVNLATGANAVDTAEAVRATVDGLADTLPEGVEVEYPYDTSPFVQESIDEVYTTLIEAVGLVFLVILVFLQNWRATLIPIIAIPVVLLGTFAGLSLLGYSINTLTMFAMVLAIGLLVDDAIVVVENVERVLENDRSSPLEATKKSMGQITGALVGIALVLSAVFLPMAFMGGSDRGDLPTVLGHDHLSDGALGARGADPDPGPHGVVPAAPQAWRGLLARPRLQPWLRGCDPRLRGPGAPHRGLALCGPSCACRGRDGGLADLWPPRQLLPPS
jgi:hypothetical protein